MLNHSSNFATYSMSAQETKQRKLPRLYEPTITLYDGSQLPQIGAGTWKHSDEVAPKAIYTSLQLGYRLLDGACGTSSSMRMCCLLNKAWVLRLWQREGLRRRLETSNCRRRSQA